MGLPVAIFPNITNVSPGSQLRALRFLVLLHAAVQTWAWFIKPIEGMLALPRVGVIAATIILTASCGLALTRYGRLAPLIALPVLFLELYWTFPWTANHTFLAFLCVLLFAVLDTRSEKEGPLLLQSLRWITVVVFFYAGLQKALYGYWFHGEFLSWMIAHGVDSWRAIFGVVAPADEVARLQALQRFEVGAGPYRVDSILFVLFSNAVYIAEMALAVLLLFKRTRAFAALGLKGADRHTSCEAPLLCNDAVSFPRLLGWGSPAGSVRWRARAMRMRLARRCGMWCGNPSRWKPPMTP